MELADLTVEVRDKSLNRVGVILPTDATFLLRNEFNGVGLWSLTIPLEHPLVPALRIPGAGIIVTGPIGTLFTGPVTRTSSAASKDDPEGLVTFSGDTDDGVLGDMLAYPVPENPTMAGQAARASDIRTGVAESVMHSFVSVNIGPAAPVARRKTSLTMGPNMGRGPSIRKSARFPVLGTLLNEIAVLGDLGFQVIQRGNVLMFETYAVNDRSKTIRMDLRNNTLASYEMSDIGAGVTNVIVGGQDAGVLRDLVERTSAASVAQAALWGRRRERFLDQRQAGEITELEQAGDKILKQEGDGQSIVKFVPMDEITMRYQVDWNLGDKVTAVIEGREVPAIVTAVIIKVDNTGVRVACALGDANNMTSDGSVTAVIKRTEARVSSLERNAEQGTRLTGEVIMFGGPTPPTGWLACDGAAVPRSTYLDLFNVIGTKYGQGNGSSTFNVPDTRDRNVVGAWSGKDRGSMGGNLTHTHSVTGTAPQHTHGLDSNGGAPFGLDGANTYINLNGPYAPGVDGNHQYDMTWSGGVGRIITSSLGLVGRTGGIFGGATLPLSVTAAAADHTSPYVAIHHIIKF